MIYSIQHCSTVFRLSLTFCALCSFRIAWWTSAGEEPFSCHFILDVAILLTDKNVSFTHLSRLMTKTTTWLVRPAKTQISLGIRPVWSESSLSAWRKLGSLATHWAHSEDSDRTGRMPRLIWVFAGRTVILLVLSWGGSLVVLARLVSWAGLEFDCIGSWSMHAV